MQNLLKGRWFSTGIRSLHRAEKFLVLKQRYELLADEQQLAISPVIAAVFAHVPAPVAGQNADDYLRAVRDSVTWADVDLIEEAIIDILPDDDLPAQLWQQRLVYSQTVTPAEYQNYEREITALNKTQPATAADVNMHLRAELRALTQRIKYCLAYGPPKEEARARLTTRVILLMCLGIAAICGAYIVAQLIQLQHGDTFIPPEAVFVVACAGLVGGFVSVQQRLQQPTDVDPLYKWLELDASGQSLLVSPIIGMIFALVFYVILVAGLVKGTVFPTFIGCAKGLPAVAAMHCNNHDLASFTLASTPDSPVSWALLTVWSFVAGFLERLVPDILTRISAVAEKN